MNQAKSTTATCSETFGTMPPPPAGAASRATLSSKRADYIYQAATVAAALLALMSV